MGYRGQPLDRGFRESLEHGISAVQKIMRPAATAAYYSLLPREDGILLTGTELVLPGRSIAKLLSRSVKCCVMAATIGLEIDREIRRLSVAGMTDSVIFDACATAAIEAVCDGLQKKAAEELGEAGYRITHRFSPGYGDLPLELQKGLLTLLQAEKRIGITLTASGLMVPCKSVTAIFGLEKKE